MKVFGILLNQIEPSSRAFSTIGLENVMKGDLVSTLGSPHESDNRDHGLTRSLKNG